MLGYSRASGGVDKRVQCEKCGCLYYYHLTRSIHAFTIMPLLMLLASIMLAPFLLLSRLPIQPLGGGWLRIRFGPAPGPALPSLGKTVDGEEDAGAANRKLRRTLQGSVEAVPCPSCGWYQRHMTEELRARSLVWMFWLSLVPLIASQPVASLLIFKGLLAGGFDAATVWLMSTGAGLLVMICLLALRYALTLRVNPNLHESDRPKDAENSAGILEREWVALRGASAIALRRATASSVAAKGETSPQSCILTPERQGNADAPRHRQFRPPAPPAPGPLQYRNSADDRAETRRKWWFRFRRVNDVVSAVLAGVILFILLLLVMMLFRPFTTMRLLRAIFG